MLFTYVAIWEFYAIPGRGWDYADTDNVDVAPPDLCGCGVDVNMHRGSGKIFCHGPTAFSPAFFFIYFACI